MNLDNFTRHVAAATIALLAVLFSGAVVWQVIHGHEVDALLAGLVGTTIGYLIPSPTQSRVTVENDPSDPVPVATAKDSGLTLVGALLIALIILVALGLGLGAHPLFFLLLLLIVVVLVA